MALARHYRVLVIISGWNELKSAACSSAVEARVHFPTLQLSFTHLSIIERNSHETRPHATDPALAQTTLAPIVRGTGSTDEFSGQGRRGSTGPFKNVEAARQPATKSANVVSDVGDFGVMQQSSLDGQGHQNRAGIREDQEQQKWVSPTLRSGVTTLTDEQGLLSTIENRAQTRLTERMAIGCHRSLFFSPILPSFFHTIACEAPHSNNKNYAARH